MSAFNLIPVAVALALELSQGAAGVHCIRIERISALQAPVSAFQQACLPLTGSKAQACMDRVGSCWDAHSPTDLVASAIILSSCAVRYGPKGNGAFSREAKRQ
jgi:hypothetical protein